MLSLSRYVSTIIQIFKIRIRVSGGAILLHSPLNDHNTGQECFNIHTIITCFECSVSCVFIFHSYVLYSLDESNF